jgi:UDP-glucose 6-dehydrogenase
MQDDRMYTVVVNSTVLIGTKFRMEHVIGKIKKVFSIWLEYPL